jgi:hypothetical protein
MVFVVVVVVVVVIALQPFVGPWPLFQFLDPIHGDRLCGLVVRVSGYRSKGPGFDSRAYQVF